MSLYADDEMMNRMARKAIGESIQERTQETANLHATITTLQEHNKSLVAALELCLELADTPEHMQDEEWYAKRDKVLTALATIKPLISEVKS